MRLDGERGVGLATWYWGILRLQAGDSADPCEA